MHHFSSSDNAITLIFFPFFKFPTTVASVSGLLYTSALAASSRVSISSFPSASCSSVVTISCSASVSKIVISPSLFKFIICSYSVDATFSLSALHAVSCVAKLKAINAITALFFIIFFSIPISILLY